MSLEEQLAQIREGSKKRIPEDKRAIIGKSMQDLRATGILDKTIKVGDTLPAFNLKNQNGEQVSSAALLAQGPLVLTVFRGHW